MDKMIFKSKTSLVVVYLLLFVAALGIISLVSGRTVFDAKNFIGSDAEHYFFIKNNGYEGFRVAFFPLFPLFWRVTGLSIYGIVCVNILCYFISFFLLVKRIQATKLELALYLAVPSFIFFYLPYTESFFFLFSTCMLLGIMDKKLWLVLVGLFFCSICRPSFTILFPALVLMELLSENNYILIAKRVVLYLLTSLLGFVMVGYMQYQDTGEWFQFFGAQKLWGNYLQVPTLPLRSWSTGAVIKLDAFALLVGLISGILVLLRILKTKRVLQLEISREVLFSLAYLGGITLSVLLFRGGSLFSLNRFVFTGPFIILVFHFYLQTKISFAVKDILWILLILNLFFLLFASYGHIQTFLKFFVLSLYVLLIFLVKAKNEKLSTAFFLIFILTNFIFQQFFLIRFLNGGWVA